MNITDYIPSGKSNAITRRDLCLAVFGEYNLTIDREVRNAIGLERSNHVILSNPKGGYYLPTEQSEIAQFVKQETSRAKTIFYRLKAARRALKGVG